MDIHAFVVGPEGLRAFGLRASKPFRNLGFSLLSAFAKAPCFRSLWFRALRSQGFTAGRCQAVWSFGVFAFLAVARVFTIAQLHAAAPD